jgi:transcriptional regulator with XRE-family HTH domain
MISYSPIVPYERRISLYNTFEKLIKERGITTYRVAKSTGISSVTFCDWKHGRSKPKTDKLIKIANYLNVPLEDLVKEES